MSAETEITDLLRTYERSLNTDDARLAVSCYTSDGMFIPTGLPTSQGGQLMDAYVKTFAAIHLDVRFTIDEVVAGEELAYAMTRSNGTQTTHATGAKDPESNRELFVFRRENGAWKISRYMFNMGR